MDNVKAHVIVRNLAFWETLIDVEGEPRTYLHENDTLKIVGSSSVYGGLFGDKEYYKVEHPMYGRGYVRVEGVAGD